MCFVQVNDPCDVAPGFLAIPTPGPTEGRCALLFGDRFLFTGDHLDFDRQEQRLAASPDSCWHSWPQQTESMRRLIGLRFEWVLPGHGQRVHLPWQEMQRHLQELVDRMRLGTGQPASRRH